MYPGGEQAYVTNADTGTMSVLLTFSVPAEDVHLGRAARAADVSVTLDPLVPLDAGLPAVRVTGTERTDYGVFEDEVRDLPVVDEFDVVERYDAGRLYSLAWSEPTGDVFADLRRAGAHLLAVDGDGETWTFETRFRDEDDLADFGERCRDAGIEVEVTSVQRGDARQQEMHGLTRHQRETLLKALDEGFYDVPRRTTTAELAEDLGISDQSLSERLRRAHAALIENALR